MSQIQPCASALPLAGVRVLDLTRIVAGPWATQNLADLGAEVIKIERPDGGDDTRQMGPPFVCDRDTGEPIDAAYFFACNRAKESVAIDIATPQGQTLVKALAGRCDVLVENYKVGGLAKYGLDYGTLHADLPRLVYCSITGFGQTGPYAQRPGYDQLIQGMGGLMSVTGERDDLPGGGPQRAGIAVVDIMSGMYAALAITAALRRRDQCGVGQHIDIAMLEVQIAVLGNQAMSYLATGVAPQRMGSGHPNLVPYQTFRASDGHLILAVGNDAQFRKMAWAMERADLADDPRFRTNPQRVAQRDVLVPLLQEIIARHGVDHWVAQMEARDVPCGPINTIDRVFADPQVRSRGVRVELPHTLAGPVPGVANPMRFSDTPVQYRKGPPGLGQHTAQVLQRVLGIGDDELQDLFGHNVIK